MIKIILNFLLVCNCVVKYDIILSDIFWLWLMILKQFVCFLFFKILSFHLSEWLLLRCCFCCCCCCCYSSSVSSCLLFVNLREWLVSVCYVTLCYVAHMSITCDMYLHMIHRSSVPLCDRLFIKTNYPANFITIFKSVRSIRMINWPKTNKPALLILIAKCIQIHTFFD